MVDTILCGAGFNFNAEFIRCDLFTLMSHRLTTKAYLCSVYINFVASTLFASHSFSVVFQLFGRNSLQTLTLQLGYSRIGIKTELFSVAYPT